MSVETLMRSQSAYAGAITRMRNRFRRIAEDDPFTYDLGQLERQLASIEHTASAYRQVHQEICTEWADSLNLDDEQDISDTFEENVETTCSLLHHLMALRQAQRASVGFQSDLEDLEEAKSTEPDGDHSVALALLTSSFQSLRVILNDSTIHADHQLRQNVVHYKSRLRNLSTEQKRDPTPIIVTTTPASARVKSVQLPKITLPHFDGDLMNWTSFWSHFHTAVDSNGELTNLNKLAYLRDVIQDPTTRHSYSVVLNTTECMMKSCKKDSTDADKYMPITAKL